MRTPFGTGAVPLTRRLLAAHPLRTAAGVAGIGLALLLVLLLDGLWTGVQQRVTTYDDHLGADLVVLPAGSDSLFADAGTLPRGTLAAVRATEGVEEADPLRAQYLVLELPDGKAAVASVSSVPGRPGGPWAMAEGRAPRAVDEIAVDAVLAHQHGLGVGDRVPVLGHPMRVVGLTSGSALFMTPLVFTTTTAMDGMLGGARAAGSVLVTASSPGQVAARLSARGLVVRTPAELHEASLALATRIYGSPLRLMVGVAFTAGVLIIALVANARIVEQTRDLGVLEALGATPGRIRSVALAETFVLTAGGGLTAVALLLLARPLLAWWRPAFPVAVTAGSLARTAAAAAVMALLAAWLPARRLARTDVAAGLRSRS